MDQIIYCIIYKLRDISLFMLGIVVLCSLCYNIQALYTAQPTWITSQLVRAGNKNVISTLTGNTQTPTFSFTFSSPLSGTPYLGYGIKAYEGNDFLGQQYFQVYRLALDSASFKVAVQILGVTNIFTLNVPYIAIDPTFPHHLNSFDNVPVNYSNGVLSNITSASSSPTSYTNIINYTDQTAGMRYRQFQTPLTRNKVLLFITSLFFAGSNEAASQTVNLRPINISVTSQVISTTQYKLYVRLTISVMITKLHFSMVIFDQTDVLSTGAYMLVYQRISMPYTGGFIPVPVEFINNFIMGMTDFSTNRTRVIIDFQWDFKVIDGVHGAFMIQSVGVSTSGVAQTINKLTYTLFYMKTWLCPNDQVETFFDPSHNLCTACPVFQCLNCQSIRVCSQCDVANNYALNTDNVCEIVCSVYTNAVSVVAGTVDTCSCETTYYWSDRSCIRNCSTISYATTLVSGSIKDCQCQTKFLWDSVSGKCLIDCSSLLNNTGRVQGSINQCICQTGYYWSSSNLSCVINCTVINYATTIVSGSNQVCNCQSKFQWNSAQQKCIINCNSLTNNQGLTANTVDVCSCNTNFTWNSTQLQCLRSCDIYPYATTLQTDSRQICNCEIKFTWSTTNNQCVIQCNSLSYTTGSVTNSYDSCTCENKFSWSSQAHQCVVQCSQIRNALQIVASTYDVCSCKEGYGWVASTKQCVFLCENIYYTNGLKENTQNECNCINNFVWDYTQLKCVVDCGAIKYALSNLQGTIQTCVCQKKFKWNIEKMCIIQCNMIYNTNGIVAGSFEDCSCKEGFIWNSTVKECVIDCSSVQYSVGLKQDSLVDCQCKKRYRWRGSLKQCILSCEDIEYTEQEWSLPQDIICPCLPNFVWNMQLKQCEYNCSSIENSTGEVKQGTTDSCICIEEHTWDEVNMVCKGKQFDHLLASFVGVGVICNKYIQHSCGWVDQCSISSDKKENIIFNHESSKLEYCRSIMKIDIINLKKNNKILTFYKVKLLFKLPIQNISNKKHIQLQVQYKFQRQPI